MNREKEIKYLDAEKNKVCYGEITTTQAMDAIQLHYLGVKLFDCTVYDYGLSRNHQGWFWEDDNQLLDRNDFVTFVSCLKDRA